MKCRKNVKNLTADEKTRFLKAVLALKSQDSLIHPGSQSRYDDFPETHMNAMMAEVDDNAGNLITPGWAHRDSVFFPWHRELLYQFEKLLQTVDATVTIPYWDWTREQNGAAAGFPFEHSFIGVDGADTDSDRVKRDPAAPPVDATHPYIYPFDPEAWSTTIDVVDPPPDTLNFFQRQFGERSDAPNLPQNDVTVTGTGTNFRAAINAANNYLTLRTRSEDLHNLVHRWVGGNMLRMTSPNDPVFFMHHAQIDRMWSIWQKKVASGTALYVGSSTLAGHKLNDPMIFNDVNPAPFATTASPADVIDGHAMHGDGLWYESDVPELTNETGPTLAFVNIPEGLTSYKAVKFRIKGCRPVHFRITGIPTGNFGLTPMGTEFIANTDASADFYYGYVWVQLVAVAGTIPPSGVDIHAYILDEEGYYAAAEGGEYALGDFHVDLTATTVARENNAVALVLDRSGSMADPAGGTSTKSDLVGNAIQVFRDLMLPNDEVAVVTFDDVVATPISMQQVNGAPAFSTVDITPRNTTWIGGGIQQGAVQLAAAALTNRSMIVLTDGNENVHPYIGEIDPALLANRTYAIGFGLPGTVSDAALNQITSNTHGDLIITGEISTDEQRFNLTKYFVQLLAGVTKMDVILDPQGSLFLGSRQVIPFQLSDADVYADIIVLCPVPKLLDFSLETPDGAIIKPSTTAPNVKYILGQQVVFYRVVLPALAADTAGSHAGQWNAILAIKRAGDIRKLSNDKAVLENVRASALRGSLPYSFVVHSYSNLNLSAYKHQESLKPGAAVTLFASVKEYDVPLQNDAVVWAQVTNPDQETVDLKLDMVTAATYSASFKTSLPGVYFCRVRAEGLTSKGTVFTREQTLTAGVYYGNYDPVPPARPGEELCRLIQCFLSEETLSPDGITKLGALGINLKHLKECIAKTCPEKIVERIPDLKYKAFLAARKKQSQARAVLSFRKATPPKSVKPPAKPVPKMPPRKEIVSNFPQLIKNATGARGRAVTGSQEMISHFPQLLEEAKSKRRKAARRVKAKRR